MNIKVFAASNTLRLSPQLISRFMVLRSNPSSKDEFLTVATNVLKKGGDVDGALASYVAEKVWQLQHHFVDPRQAVRVARLAKTREEVDVLSPLGWWSPTALLGGRTVELTVRLASTSTVSLGFELKASG